jgi:hypothetical protein
MSLRCYNPLWTTWSSRLDMVGWSFPLFWPTFQFLSDPFFCSVCSLLLSSSLYLLPVNLLNLIVLVLAIADVCQDAALWANGRRIGMEQMFPTTLVKKPSVPTAHPARPPFSYKDNVCTVPQSIQCRTVGWMMKCRNMQDSGNGVDVR